MKSEKSQIKVKNFTFWIVVFSFSFFIFNSRDAYADTVTFFVDSTYDWLGSERVTATLQHEGLRARFYVSDQYWYGLGASGQLALLSDMRNLSGEFDSVIYPKLRDIFGSENTPGVDGDPKITILLSRMKEDAGGYIREQDGFPREKISVSNAREMINLNVSHVGKQRAKSFLAHEFQHLITLNQKILQRSVQEEVWLNELRSEIAPTLLGYDNPDVYLGSNLEARAAAFLKIPSDAILDWENEIKDYASINLFAQYILDHYGRSVLAAMAQSDKAGIASFNEALSFFGFKETFSDVYTNWIITNLVNNCALLPINTYCYKNPSLSNFRLKFGLPDAGGKTITSEETTKDWRADWNKFEVSLGSERPADHVFRLDFNSPETSNFRVPYVVYDRDGLVLGIKELTLEKGNGVFFVEDFGYRIPKIVVITSNQSQLKGTQGNAPSVSFLMTATTVTTLPSVTTTMDLAPSLPDYPEGTLIRAEGGYKVYIIQNGYKRWIQSAEIFNFYGHLNFSVVQVVSPGTLALYKDAWLVRAADDPKVYEVNGDGTRHWLDMTPEKFTATGRLWDMVYVINKSELLWYMEGLSVK
ncbi:MAG: hypothetical protein WAP23_01820 [Candidatus Spechtbacterales bacterium]